MMNPGAQAEKTFAPPSLSLKMVTSAGSLLVFAPYFLRFGFGDPLGWLLVLPYFLCLWGLPLKRASRLRGEVMWGHYQWASETFFGALSVMALAQFRLPPHIGFMPRLWLIPALVMAVISTWIAVRYGYGMEKAGRGGKIFVASLWPFVAFFFAIGTLTYLNGAFDFQASRLYPVLVLKKRIDNASKGSRPLLTVQYWHNKKQSEELQVDFPAWNRAQVGKMANVSVKPGLLGRGMDRIAASFFPRVKAFTLRSLKIVEEAVNVSRENHPRPSFVRRGDLNHNATA